MENASSRVKLSAKAVLGAALLIGLFAATLLHLKTASATGKFSGMQDPAISAVNRETKAQDKFGGWAQQLTAAPDQTIVNLTSGAPVTGSIAAPQPGSAVLGGTQYTINVPAGATQLNITLSGNQDVDLFARFGQAIAVSNGQLVADYGSATIGSGNETITITPSSSPALQPGTYYIAVGNFGPGAATFTLTATVSGGQGSVTAELFVDDGSFENAIGLTQGGTQTAVNRLTPTSYPATLTGVKIYFRGGQNISTGASFTIQAGANPSGSGNITGIALQPTAATVQALDQFVTYTVPSVTINSGDFVVGFRITTSAGALPFSLDETAPSRQRSYISTSSGFALIDSLNFPGNFGIRALVNLPQQCDYSITPTSQFFNAGGGTGSVMVNAPAGCAWTAASNSSFITITSGASGSGSGPVVFSVAANQIPAQRTGTMTIAGQTFTVTQAAATPSTIALTSGVSQTGSVGAANPGACVLLVGTQYTIQVPSGASQLGVTLSGDQDVDLYVRFGQPLAVVNGQIVYDYRSASTGNTESLTLTPASAPPLQAGTYYIGVNNCSVNTANFTLTATVTTPQQCSYAISPTSQNIISGGGADSVNVSSGGGCAWTAASNAAWITITSGASGSGNGQVAYSVAANNSATQRTGTMTIAGQTFTVTQDGQAPTARTLLVVSVNGVQGGTLNVPIDLVSLGDENGVSFSLNFDQAVLSNPQATLGDGVPAGTALLTNSQQTNQGRFGVALTLPTGQKIAASPPTRRIVVVSFSIAPNPNITTTNISIGNAPVQARIGDAQGSSLPFNQVSGTVTILPGYEADVTPRPTGKNNGTVDIFDALQVGKFAVAIDTPNNGSEFQRADCAPAATKGDGQINLFDWQQAAIYVANPNTVVPAGGPTGPSFAPSDSASLLAAQSGEASQTGPRVIRVVNANGQPGGTVDVVVQIDAQGNEGAFSFSLTFDPAILSMPTIKPGSGLPSGSQFLTNSNQAAQGRFGIAILAPIGQALAAGTRELAVVTFKIAPSASGASTPVGFGDQPLARLVGDKDGGNITTATTFTGGAVTINQPGNPVPSIAGLSPNAATAGAAAFLLTVNGANFVNGATVQWNGSARTTTFGGPAQLTAQITAADIATAGTASVTVINPAPGGGTSNAASFTINPPQTTNRTVRVVASSGGAGATVSAPVELISQGDENAVGFSLNFNPSVLSNPQVALGGDAAGAQLNVNTSQVAQGRIGIALALGAGQTFSAGTRRIVVVTFNIAAGTGVTTTPIDFADQPILRQVADTSARALPANFTAAAVTITQGVEADVAPASGDGVVGMGDWTQTGRYVAGLDAINPGSEFQRADSAPRDNLGDGKLTIIDWVQAGRYAANLDPPTAAGGPTAPASPFAVMNDAEPSNEQQSSRVVRVGAASFERGQNGSVVIELDAQGDENAIGFSVSFDPAQLRFVSASPGADAADALLNVNSSQSANGRIGVAVALPANRSFAAGARRIVVLNFMAAGDGNSSTTAINFADQPIMREVAAVTARALQASFSGGSATINRTVASVSAASFLGAELAPESIVAAFGAKLATEVKIANTIPLPTDLAGTKVAVKDSAGVERQSPLFFVAPNQINYLMPPGSASGAATITVTSGDGAISTGKANIAAVSPALFTANASGQGVAAAVALRVKPDGRQIFEPVSQFDPAQNRFTPIPIDLGPEGDQVFLILYGTGVRFRSGLPAVTASIGGLNSQVLYAGAADGFVGLDQVNLSLPRSLAGRGDVEIKLSADGKAANTVTIRVK